MIVTNIENCSRYENLHPKFKLLFDFIRENTIKNLDLGRIELCGDVLFINNVLLDGVDAAKQPMEIHRQYIDVHLLLEGNEAIGYLPIEEITTYSKEYSAEGDCALTTDKPSNYIVLKPNDMVIFYPEDAHSPAIGSGKIRKIIAKVKL